MRGCRGQIDDKAGEIRWKLTFGDLESDATQSHIHFENSDEQRARGRVPLHEPG